MAIRGNTQKFWRRSCLLTLECSFGAADVELQMLRQSHKAERKQGKPAGSDEPDRQQLVALDIERLWIRLG